VPYFSSVFCSVFGAVGRSIHVFCPEQISVALVEAIGGPE